MRKKRTIVDEDLPEVSTDIDSDVSDIIVVLSKVYKLNNGARSFCFQTQEPVDEVSVQAQYPSGGKFVVLEYNGLNQLVNTTHIDIEPKPLPVGVNGNGVMDLQNRLLMDEIAWTRQMLMQLLTNKNGNQPATPVIELVQALQGIHSLAPNGRDPIELLIKGMELGAKSNGASGDWKSDLIHTAKEVLTPAVEAFGAFKQQQLTQHNPMITNALPSVSILKQGITWIKSKILSGLEPDFAVGWIVRNANEYQPFLELAIKGSIESFIELDSEIANEPYRTWFTTAIQLLKDEYEQQSANNPDVDGGNGDSSDVAVNEESRPRKSKITKVV
ncbi:hypothetical protein L0244_38750 [bacterium]|nr:hypothetical protein [bacterium]